MQPSEFQASVNRKWRAYIDQVVNTIRTLPHDCRQSGDDSALANVWEEFKYQVQREESGMFEAYVQTVQDICNRLLTDVPDNELEVLWLDSDAHFDYDDEQGSPSRDDMLEGTCRELYQKVLNRAADEELEVDPEEQRQRQNHEDVTPI